MLTIYDDHGLYGHPDHIQVHRVGRLAGERAGMAHVYEATVGRERAFEGFKAMAAEIQQRIDAAIGQWKALRARHPDYPGIDRFIDRAAAERDRAASSRDGSVERRR